MFEKERAEIDIIDRELVKLFERRMDAVTEIARI
ncbi:MAG: chorismate mutase [Trichococcus flocculiformis]|nr:chorismate mutase [Trichococcus flocculiformis]